MRFLLLILVLLLPGGRSVHPSTWDASTPGPYGIAERREGVEDHIRMRSLGLITVFPSSDGRTLLKEPGPYPLVVFSHGFLLRGDFYLSYARHLASYGFVVALPTYPGSLANFSHLALKEDLQFVIDYYLRTTSTADHPLQGAVDSSRIGVSGHSLGGKISLLAASEDTRIRASATLDPVDGVPPGGGDPVLFPRVTPERMSSIHIPLLLLGSDRGRESLYGQACAPEDENYQRFFEAANPPAIEVTQVDVGHLQYLDNPDCCGNICPTGRTPSEEVRNMARAYLTAFYRGHLQENSEALQWLDERLSSDEAAGKIIVRRKQ